MMKNSKLQQGVSLYLAVITLSIVLAITLGLTTVLLGQLKMLRGVENSVVAFYAADTGIERILVGWGSPDTSLCNPVPCSLDGAQYEIEVKAGGAVGCSADTYCIKSAGSYRGVKRAIEITY